MNLLPFAISALRHPSEGVYLGDGIPHVAEKLAIKIRNEDFIEMGELLPEFWSPSKGEEGDASREIKD